MARTQAADYDQRREAIMMTAAKLYADHGFLGASVAQIAVACKTSKSLIYHYYPSKEDILFDVMDSHVQKLVEVCREIAAGPEAAAGKVRLIASALMQLYKGAEANQKVLLNELKNLPVQRRQTVIEHQRSLLDLVDGLIVELRPALRTDKPRRRVLAMLFFGMLNWTHTWLSPDGPVSGETVAAMAAQMLLSSLETPRTAIA